jgi:hygromycin-B 7''-O-kinase
VRADVYLQPYAADPVLTDAVVLGLCARHAPRVRAVTGVDESGGEARVYLVDDGIVLKTQRPHRLRPRTSLAKEAYLLDLLASEWLPRLLGYDRAETEQGAVEYLCMTRVPGRAVQYTTLPVDARRSVLSALGGVLRAVHATPVDPARLPGDADAAALRQRLEDGFGDIADTVAERGAPTVPMPSTVDEAIERAMAAVPDALTDAPVLLHSNPGATHVFVDPSSARFTGLIDFGDSYVSHAALDLRRWPDPAHRLTLLDGYLNGVRASPEFTLMWTVAMIQADLAAIVAGSPHALDAARDLAVRLDGL